MEKKIEFIVEEKNDVTHMTLYASWKGTKKIKY